MSDAVPVRSDQSSAYPAEPGRDGTRPVLETVWIPEPAPLGDETVRIPEAAPRGDETVRIPEAPPRGDEAVPRPRWHYVLKRLVDIVGSLVLIVVLLPFAAIIALAIVLESPGPVVFVHRRVGRNRKPFPLVKFRTMYRDSGAALAEALASDEALRLEWEQWRKLRRDPRVTRVGRVLRRLSLDELPQVLNVLIGNMSLVGPRPVMEDELRYFGTLAEPVLSVRPGLTGRWAVSGRSEISYEERVQLEYEYATAWTPLGDVGILLRTVPAVFRGHGAY
jgi:exopolysaccharide production protein ExoY